MYNIEHGSVSKWKKKHWHTLASLSAETINTCNGKPCYYLDVNGKEWLMILLCAHSIHHSPNIFHSYLYDVVRDKYVPFIRHYDRNVNKRFGIDHFRHDYLNATHVRRYMSYTVDNKNHLLYWLEIESTNDTETVMHCSLIALDIKDLQNIKLTKQTLLSCQEYPWLSGAHYHMLIVGNTIQFIGLYDGITCLNFEFNIKTQKFKLICENVLPTRVNCVTKSNMLHLSKHFQIGDWIDVRDLKGKFYLAQIVNIRNHADSMAISILIHYYGWHKNYDEWIHASEMSICDCTHKCRFWGVETDKNRTDHRIALPRSQSMYNQRLYGSHAFYSDNYQKMILFGTYRVYYSSTVRHSCVFYKNHGKHPRRDYKLVIFGFIRQQFETKYNVLVPYDLYNLIFKYYFIPDDKTWHQMIDTDKTGKFIGDTYCDTFSYDSDFVLLNDGKDVYIFGNVDESILKLNINTMEMRRLISIDMKCLSFGWRWYAVLCHKSKSVHLFTSSLNHHVRIRVCELNAAPSVAMK